MNNYTIFIGGVDITAAALHFTFTQRLNDMATGTIKLQREKLHELPPLNYAAEVCITRLRKPSGKVMFRGSITSATPTLSDISLELAAGIDVFEETIIQGMAVADVGNLEMLWSIVRGAGLGEERINIEGFTKGPMEPFEVIVPLDNLELSADIVFTNTEITKDPKIFEIASSTTKDKEFDVLSEFGQSGIWIRVIVRAKTLHDAENDGLRNIDIFLARLTSRIQLSVSRIGAYDSQWNRNNLFGKPVRGDVVLVRGLTTRRRWLRRPFSGNTPKLDLSQFKDLDYPSLTVALPEYLQEALLAWQRSNHANHPLASITAIWDAIEFYSSQIKVAGDFTKSEIRQIRKDAVKSIPQADDAKRNRVADVLGLLNQASLIMKFDLAMKEDGIVLSDEETAVLKNLRQTRNDFVHGNKITMPSDAEMLLARATVNRILVARIHRLAQNN